MCFVHVGILLLHNHSGAQQTSHYLTTQPPTPQETIHGQLNRGWVLLSEHLPQDYDEVLTWDHLHCLETTIAHTLVACSNMLPNCIPLLQKIEHDIRTRVQLTLVQSDATAWYTVLGTYAVLAAHINQVMSRPTCRGLFPPHTSASSPQPLPSTPPSPPSPCLTPSQTLPSTTKPTFPPPPPLVLPHTAPHVLNQPLLPSNPSITAAANHVPTNPTSFDIHFPNLTNPSHTSAPTHPIPNFTSSPLGPPPPTHSYSYAHCPTDPVTHSSRIAFFSHC